MEQNKAYAAYSALEQLDEASAWAVAEIDGLVAGEYIGKNLEENTEEKKSAQKEQDNIARFGFSKSKSRVEELNKFMKVMDLLRS